MRTGNDGEGVGGELREGFCTASPRHTSVITLNHLKEGLKGRLEKNPRANASPPPSFFFTPKESSTTFPSNPERRRIGPGESRLKGVIHDPGSSRRGSSSPS